MFGMNLNPGNIVMKRSPSVKEKNIEIPKENIQILMKPVMRQTSNVVSQVSFNSRNSIQIKNDAEFNITRKVSRNFSKSFKFQSSGVKSTDKQ